MKRTSFLGVSSKRSCRYSCMHAESLHSCQTLCDPIDGSPPGSPVLAILQARILEWVAISFSNAWKWKVKVELLGRVRLFAISWTAAYQAPPPMGFSREEYWNGLPLPFPECCLGVVLYGGPASTRRSPSIAPADNVGICCCCSITQFWSHSLCRNFWLPNQNIMISQRLSLPF